MGFTILGELLRVTSDKLCGVEDAQMQVPQSAKFSAAPPWMGAGGGLRRRRPGQPPVHISSPPVHTQPPGTLLAIHTW